MYARTFRFAVPVATAILLTVGLARIGHRPISPAPAQENPRADKATAKGAAKPKANESVAKPRFQPARKAIEAALERSVASGFDFLDTPLSGVAKCLQREFEIPVVIDRRGLEDDGLIPEETLVTFCISHVPLRDALRLMLNKFDLTFAIHHDVLLITTPHRVYAKPMETRVYEVADLVICRDEQGRLWDDYDSLIEVVVNAVEQESWVEFGGPGTIEGLSIPGAKTLIIRQTDEVHREVAKLLDDLVKLRADRPGGNLPPLRQYQLRPFVIPPMPVVGQWVRPGDAREAEAVEPPGEALTTP